MMFDVCREPNENDKYYIAVSIVIYRELFGKYPDFLKDFENSAHLGYTTKFTFLVPGTETMSKLEADMKRHICETQYEPMLRNCENTGDWSNSPFDFSKMELLRSA